MLTYEFENNKNLKIVQLQVGSMGNLCYILMDMERLECAVVDPGWDVEVIEKEIDKNNLEVKKIILTHHHFDHVGVVDKLQYYYKNVDVYMSSQEVEFYNFYSKNLVKMEDLDVIKVGGLDIKVYHTPGHTVGGCCLYVGSKYLITGDTLFIDSCGRCDLEGGDIRSLQKSLERIVEEFDGGTIILPGHDYSDQFSSSLKGLIRSNPYLQFRNNENEDDSGDEGEKYLQ